MHFPYLYFYLVPWYAGQQRKNRSVRFLVGYQNKPYCTAPLLPKLRMGMLLA